MATQLASERNSGPKFYEYKTEAQEVQIATSFIT